MILPEKTFLKTCCRLHESDFGFDQNVKMLRVLQFLQDAATQHGEQLGLGWNAMDANGILWVLSKIKVVFDKPVTRKTQEFLLYTWPLAPTRFFAERCFTAVTDEGQIFSATSFWSLISKEQRKILPAEKMNEFFHGEYSSAHCDASADYVRVRFDETFVPVHEKTVRRSDLDLNGHVNNTNYATYASDVLSPEEEILSMEIVFHKELKLGDKLTVYAKRQDNFVTVVGRREDTCFSAVIQLATV